MRPWDTYPRRVAAEAFVLAFAAAWIHGASDVFLGRRPEPEAAIAMMLVIGVVAAAPGGRALTWRVEAGAWPYIAASALLELGYFAFLAAAYPGLRGEPGLPGRPRRGPGARAARTVVVLGRGTTTGQVVGVVAVCAAIPARPRRQGRGGSCDSRGFLLALVTAAFIAGYTLVDKAGLNHAAPIPYIELVLIGPTLVYVLAIRAPSAASRR